MQPLKKEKDPIRFFREQVLEMILKKYPSVQQFSEKYNINHSIFSLMFNAKASEFRLKTLSQIAEALDKKLIIQFKENPKKLRANLPKQLDSSDPMFVLRHQLKRLILEQYPTIEKFAYGNDFHKSTLSEFFNGKNPNPKKTTLQKMAHALGTELIIKLE